MELPENHIMRKTVVYQITGTENVDLERDLAWEGGEDGPLNLDIYRPQGTPKGERRPAVVSVAGYPDPGMERMFGCGFQDSGSSTSRGRLLAAAGLVAVNYSTREPAGDLGKLPAGRSSATPWPSCGFISRCEADPARRRRGARTRPSRPGQIAAIRYPLNPKLQTFAEWAKANKDRIPIG